MKLNTPWSGSACIFDSNGEYVGTAKTGQVIAEVCRRVNAHDALVVACQEAIEYLDLANDDPTSGETYALYAKLRDALALAKGT